MSTATAYLAPTIHAELDGKNVGEVVAQPQTITAAYIRLTRDESLRKGLSAPAQKADIREYIDRADLPVMKVYEELQAIGGDVPFGKRDAGRQLIEDIRARRVAHLVVRDMDRLSRDVRMWLDLMELCLEKGVQIHTLSGPLEIEAPTDEFAAIVRAAAAMLERKQIGDRVRRVKRELARRGRHVGGPPPYGYTSQARRRAELSTTGVSEQEAKSRAEVEYPQTGHLYVDEKEARMVRLIFDLYVHRRWGCRRVVNELNRRGNRRRPLSSDAPGRLWHPDKIRRIICDPVLAGFIPYDSRRFETRGRQCTPRAEQELHPGKHDAIIPAELWRRAQEIRKANTCHRFAKASGVRGNRKYALSGILRCRCGSRMKAGSTRADKRYCYYVCSNRKYYGPDAIGGCSFPRINIRKVHDAFWPKLSELIQTPGLVDRVWEVAKQMLAERSRVALQEPDITRTLTKIEADLAVWYERHDAAQPKLEKDAAWRRILELTAEAKDLSRSIEDRSKTDEMEPRSIARDAVEKYVKSLGDLVEETEGAGVTLVQSLVEHHGLKVTLKDVSTLAISLALRPPTTPCRADDEHVVRLDGDARMPKDKVTEWVKQNQTQNKCEICNKQIRVHRRHYWRGTPKYHPKCWARSLAERRAKAIGKEFYTGQQVAQKLRIGRTTVNRWVNKNKLPAPVKRKSGMVLFDRAAIDEFAMAHSTNNH